MYRRKNVTRFFINLTKADNYKKNVAIKRLIDIVSKNGIFLINYYYRIQIPQKITCKKRENSLKLFKDNGF